MVSWRAVPRSTYRLTAVDTSTRCPLPANVDLTKSVAERQKEEWGTGRARLEGESAVRPPQEQQGRGRGWRPCRREAAPPLWAERGGWSLQPGVAVIKSFFFSTVKNHLKGGGNKEALHVNFLALSQREHLPSMATGAVFLPLTPKCTKRTPEGGCPPGTVNPHGPSVFPRPPLGLQAVHKAGCTDALVSPGTFQTQT